MLRAFRRNNFPLFEGMLLFEPTTDKSPSVEPPITFKQVTDSQALSNKQ
jgi:hypothetical protein